jgi:hypothetical protein
MFATRSGAAMMAHATGPPKNEAAPEVPASDAVSVITSAFSNAPTLNHLRASDKPTPLIDCGGGRSVYARDRASLVAAAIMHIIATAPECERREAIASYLRDELSDVARTAFNEIRPEDE